MLCGVFLCQNTLWEKEADPKGFAKKLKGKPGALVFEGGE